MIAKAMSGPSVLPLSLFQHNSNIALPLPPLSDKNTPNPLMINQSNEYNKKRGVLQMTMALTWIAPLVNACGVPPRELARPPSSTRLVFKSSA